MKLRRLSSLADAESSEAGFGTGSVALAGGTEVVPLLRDGLLAADTLVDVRAVVPGGISAYDGGVRIGAGTTLAELEHADASLGLPEVLVEACRLSASPQIRNMGTIAGNLLQATRCWYWRLGHGCWLAGGEKCLARDGRSDEHAVFGNSRCASAHPSDPAAALLALGASVRTSRRELPVADLYRLPTDDDRSVTALEPGELILEIDVPRPDASAYLKAMDRKRYAFALVGVAAVRSGDDVRVALAAVAPVPWLLESPDGDAVGFGDATPLPGSAYKIELAQALVRRAKDAIAPAG
ncbi:FAD binding domain-containing protein [Actinopolymorpha pittospori]|uniref:Xanthine dehydrogenase YagS FAD-binding subunit n=1 Tax=Actinopolymorpha pittospori TaxID=648752 RepID=A0A927RGM8_9ACTN|nr:FAD binding domain-containing protein [Actinopolymorpha pittospori]MBE1604366.1 xanthine dehydrogenase YagS FAD-binding subunit [Actinopolymorpha pittospori]